MSSLARPLTKYGDVTFEQILGKLAQEQKVTDKKNTRGGSHPPVLRGVNTVIRFVYEEKLWFDESMSV